MVFRLATISMTYSDLQDSCSIWSDDFSLCNGLRPRPVSRAVMCIGRLSLWSL